jgi:hypothetical protein
LKEDLLEPKVFRTLWILRSRIIRGIKEFETYCYDKILPAVEPLENDRTKLVKKVSIAIVLEIIVGIVLLIILVGMEVDIRVFILYIGLCIIIIKGMCMKYTENYKDTVIKLIVRFFGENLVYYKDRHINRNEFDSSELFGRYNRYYGDDYVEGLIPDEEYIESTGKLKGTKIRFSELDVKLVTGSGKNRSTKTVFKGMFYVADFNKYFKTYTKVIPDYRKSWFKRKTRVKLEDVEFEKLFEVYSEDQIEARYILSTSLMRRIVEYKRKTGHEIYIAFNNNKIFVAVRIARDLFEPRIFTTLYDIKPLYSYYNDLMMVISIVDELNLNQRIWTRE